MARKKCLNLKTKQGYFGMTIKVVLTRGQNKRYF